MYLTIKLLTKIPDGNLLVSTWSSGIAKNMGVTYVTPDPFPDPFRKVGSLQGSSPCFFYHGTLMEPVTKAEALSLYPKEELIDMQDEWNYSTHTKASFFNLFVSLLLENKALKEVAANADQESLKKEIETLTAKLCSAQKVGRKAEDEFHALQAMNSKLQAENEQSASVVVSHLSTIENLQKELNVVNQPHVIPFLGQDIVSVESSIRLILQKGFSEENPEKAVSEVAILTRQFSNFCSYITPKLQAGYVAVRKGSDSLVRRFKTVEN